MKYRGTANSQVQTRSRWKRIVRFWIWESRSCFAEHLLWSKMLLKVPKRSWWVISGSTEGHFEVTSMPFWVVWIPKNFKLSILSLNCHFEGNPRIQSSFHVRDFHSKLTISAWNFENFRNSALFEGHLEVKLKHFKVEWTQKYKIHVKVQYKTCSVVIRKIKTDKKFEPCLTAKFNRVYNRKYLTAPCGLQVYTVSECIDLLYIWWNHRISRQNDS